MTCHISTARIEHLRRKEKASPLFAPETFPVSSRGIFSVRPGRVRETPERAVRCGESDAPGGVDLLSVEPGGSDLSGPPDYSSKRRRSRSVEGEGRSRGEALSAQASGAMRGRWRSP